jgi:predicted transcriptional regulator
MEEAGPVTNPDFDHMTKDEVIAWFDTTEDISPILASMRPAAEPITPASGSPMVLASIRLPVEMVEQLDSLADLDRSRRSDIIRAALAAYISARTAPVDQDEAERALDTLRRVVANRTTVPQSNAA